MLLTTANISDEFTKYSSNNLNSNYFNLLFDAEKLILELEAHKGKEIEIGNNAFTPLNEKKYVLKDYSLFKLLDGINADDLSLCLIIVVEDSNGEEISFSYPYISKIDESILGDQTGQVLKYHIMVRNKVFDHSIDPNTGKLFPYIKANKDISNYIQNHSYTTYRFLLFD